MKILFPYMARWRSANRSRYHQLLTQLCRRGHRVFILTAPPMALADISARDIDEDRELPPGMFVSELFAPAPLRAFWELDIPRAKLLKKGLIAISSLGQIRRMVKREAIDLLFLYNLPQVILPSLADCAVHFDLADDLVAMMEGEDRHLFRFGGRKAAQLVQERLLARADTVTVASSVLAEQIDRPVLMLPNGADLEDLDRLALRAGAAGTSQTPGRRPVVGFVGAFEYWVDLELLTRVAEALPQCEIRLVGGGRRLGELREMIGRRGLANVSLTGPKPYDEAMRLVAGMDVCLLPFVHSAVADGSCPLKLFEYAALRRPIVSTSTTEVRRIGEGWISFADHPPEMAEAVRQCLADAAGTQRRVEKGRRIVESDYTWPDLAARFEDWVRPR